MNLRDLEYIIAVAELKNFSQAAERCHISQPTLSCQIKKAEELLGVRIFERTNKRVMLTDIGDSIVASAKRILQEVDVMKETAQLAQDPTGGTFRLGGFHTLAPYIFPSLVPQIREDLPKLKLILVEEKTDKLVEMLLKGELDAALLALPFEHDLLTSESLFSDEFMVAVQPEHSFAHKASISSLDLSDQPLLLLEEGHCLREQALDFCHTTGANEQEDVRATGLETLRQMVIAGTGITLIPHIATHENESKHIRYIPFSEPKPQRTIGLVWRKTSTRTEVIQTINRLIKNADSMNG